MTYAALKKAGLATLATLAMTATLPAASAMAADAPAAGTFIVKSTTDGRIRAGVRAFQKGQFEKSVSRHRSALKSPLSPKRAAIAHSNLCAAYAKLEQMDNAKAACSSALELRPDYAPALANKAALTIRLAQK